MSTDVIIQRNIDVRAPKVPQMRYATHENAEGAIVCNTPQPAQHACWSTIII